MTIRRIVSVLTPPCVALEGADLTLTYVAKEKEDAEHTEELIQKKLGNSRKIQMLELDLRQESSCKQLIDLHLKIPWQA